MAFEEPENGVPPRRIEVIADLLAGMVRDGRQQVVVTTHSAVLVSSLAQRKREVGDGISLLRCSRRGRWTTLEPFDPLPLFEDRELREALIASEDERVMEGLLCRGWLDG